MRSARMCAEIENLSGQQTRLLFRPSLLSKLIVDDPKPLTKYIQYRRLG